MSSDRIRTAFCWFLTEFVRFHKNTNDTVACQPYLSTLVSGEGGAPGPPAEARGEGRSAAGPARQAAEVRVERYGSRATVSFESLHIRIPLKFCQNSAKLSQFFRNSENFRTSQHFLECSAKFRKKIIKICAKFDENCRKIRIFAEIRANMWKKFDEFLRRFWVWSGAKVCKSCRSRKMLKNEYLVAKIGFDTEENEPSKVW